MKNKQLNTCEEHKLAPGTWSELQNLRYYWKDGKYPEVILLEQEHVAEWLPPSPKKELYQFTSTVGKCVSFPVPWSVLIGISSLNPCKPDKNVTLIIIYFSPFLYIYRCFLLYVWTDCFSYLFFIYHVSRHWLCSCFQSVKVDSSLALSCHCRLREMMKGQLEHAFRLLSCW